MKPRSAAALAVSAALAALPAAASGAPPASLDTSYPCYAGGESVMLSGSGFTPQGAVSLSVSGQQLTTLEADLDGDFAVRVRTPRPFFGTTRMRFSATDRAQPALTAATTVRIADTDVVVTPAIGGPLQIRRIRAWGYFGVDAVYAHVKRRGAPRARNVRLGRPRGACGVLDVRRRLFKRVPRPGAYTLQFDALRRYYPNVESSVSYSVRVLDPALARASGFAAAPSTTQTRSERPRGLPPTTPFRPPRVNRRARRTTTSRLRLDAPLRAGRSARHWKLTSPRSLKRSPAGGSAMPANVKPRWAARKRAEPARTHVDGAPVSS